MIKDSKDPVSKSRAERNRERRRFRRFNRGVKVIQGIGTIFRVFEEIYHFFF